MVKRRIPDEVRRICYERDQWTCQEQGCGLSRDNGGVMNLHHIQPEQFGGQETPNNLITLCDIHHKNMHSEFNAFYPDSYSVLKRMNLHIQGWLSKFKDKFGFDDGLDLKPYLQLLTGKNKFRLGQLEVIRAAARGENVLFVTPTGSGKSVCYQLPGLLSSKPSLVISPLNALMKDQVEGIWRKKIPATYINSNLSSSERQNRYRFIAQNLYKFIFVAPERFKSQDLNLNHLYRKYSHLVVDEAHEIEAWGMSFRPSYRSLGDLRNKLGNPPVIALTATASKSTQRYILESLGIPDAKVIVTGFYRSNIKIKINKDFKVTSSKFKHIRFLLEQFTNQKVLIFVPTMKLGKELQLYLRRHNIKVPFFHSRLDSKVKMRLQNLYTGIESPELQVLISTSAFGMGIDIPNIRHIIHLSPALSLTDYVQQIGRAGRDGLQSTAHLLYSPQDIGLLKFIASNQLKQPGFKEEYGYSDQDLLKVQAKLFLQIKEMLGLLSQPLNYEWKYIIDYFDETQFSIWQRRGKSIMLMVVVILLTLILAGLTIIIG